MRYRLRILLIAAVSVGAVSLVGFAVFALNAQAQMVRNAYCLDWATAAIVQYMDDHEGQYPGDWGQLKEAFDKVTSADHSFSYEEVQSRVAIDFSVGPKMPPDQSFQFVTVRSGPRGHWGPLDPNERIRLHILKLQEGARGSP